jgi:Zn-dependent protease
MFGDRREFSLFSVGSHRVSADSGAAILLLLMVLFQMDAGALGAVVGLAVGFGVLLSVLAHELGHAFAVSRLGFGGSSIVLGMFGGVCRWRGNPRPLQRVTVALAGPTVSLAVGLALSAIDDFVPNPVARMVVGHLAFLNLLWFAFNLLPMLPMDGGVALNGLLSSRMPQLKAARISLVVSMVVGAGALVVAVNWRYTIAAVMIGMMVWQNWQQYAELKQARE